MKRLFLNINQKTLGVTFKVLSKKEIEEIEGDAYSILHALTKLPNDEWCEIDITQDNQYTIMDIAVEMHKELQLQRKVVEEL